MTEYTKFGNLKDRVENVKSIEDFNDLITPKLDSYDDLQQIQKAVLSPQIEKRFNLKSGNFENSEQLQNVTNQILEQDYPHINKLRKMVGEGPITTKLTTMPGGSYSNISKEPNAGANIRIGKNSSQGSTIPTLAHEIGHSNDDIFKLISSIISKGDNDKSAKLRDMVLSSNDKDIQSFLQDLEKNPNISNKYITKRALNYDSPKIQQHLDILKNNPELVNSSRELQGLQRRLIDQLAKKGDKINLDKILKDDHKLSNYIQDYEKYFIPSESSGLNQYGSDYEENKVISDIVQDNSILLSNADRHHLPRIDEVNKTGLLDKGNWELRNIGRLFSGKGLKSIAALAGPVLKATGIGATGLAALGIGNKAMAGDFRGAISDTGELASDMTPIIGDIKGELMGNAELPQEEMEKQLKFNLLKKRLGE